jgi:hypothetical protein
MTKSPLVVLLLIIVGVQAVVLGRQMYWPAVQKAEKQAVVSKTSAVQVERIPGSDAKRLTLSAKAAQRIDIQTGNVREQQVARRRMVPGEVIALAPATAASRVAAPAGSNPAALATRLTAGTPVAPDRSGAAIVRIQVTDDIKTFAQGPALVFASGNATTGLQANPSDPPGDARSADKAVYYSVEGAKLAVGDRVRVAFSMASSDNARKVVPVAAVLYNATGASWVYTTSEPLVFVRHPVKIDFVEGDLAVLTEGPSNGVSVVTVGAMELWGSEFYVGH